MVFAFFRGSFSFIQKMKIPFYADSFCLSDLPTSAGVVSNKMLRSHLSRMRSSRVPEFLTAVITGCRPPPSSKRSEGR
jgi:hypothetical protein